MSLKILAENAVHTFGLQHTLAIRTLRDYLNAQLDESLVREIKGIQDASTLRAIWEAGVRKNLQPTYMQRLGEIT